MSRQTLNHALGLAIIDPDFCQAFLSDPVKTVRAHNIEITEQEATLLQSICARDIYDFSQQLQAHLKAKDQT